MHPEILRFTYFGVERPVYSYGLMVVLAATAGVALAAARARRYGVARFDEFALALLCVVGGVAGAFLLHLVLELRSFLADPVGFLRQPGMVFYGGLPGAALLGYAYVRRYRLPLGAMVDAGVPGLSLGHAIGRLGCFLGGCCFGRPSDGPLGVRFGDPRAPATVLSAAVGPLHPVQLYESAGLLALTGVLLLASRPLAARPGLLFSLYLGLYALLRLATEGFRGDAVRGFVAGGALSTSQAISLGLLLLAAALAARQLRRRPAGRQT